MRYFNGKKEITIDESWDESPRETYREIILADGYLPIIEAAHPERSIFQWDRQAFELNEEGTAYIESWIPNYIKISISVNKLLSHPALADKINVITEIIKNDEKLRKWLVDECVYLRNSPMAEYACTTLGLTVDQLESIVSDCRSRF